MHNVSYMRKPSIFLNILASFGNFARPGDMIVMLRDRDTGATHGIPCVAMPGDLDLHQRDFCERPDSYCFEHMLHAFEQMDEQDRNHHMLTALGEFNVGSTVITAHFFGRSMSMRARLDPDQMQRDSDMVLLCKGLSESFVDRVILHRGEDAMQIVTEATR